MGQSDAKANAKKRAAKRAKAKAAKGGKGGATRPRQHVLEKLSKRAFASALPESMVERDLPDDYGVDYEVELFDEDGNRTGFTFKVQLKSTDSKAPKRSVKVSDFAYWSTLDVPVLLVLYIAGTGELLSTWAHGHNPWPPPVGKKSTTVKFDKSFSTQLEQVPRDLERIREVRASVLRGPVTLGVHGDDTAAVLRLRHALRTAVNDLGVKRFMKVVNDDDAHAVVTWRDDAIVVAGPTGMGSLTVHNMEFDDITDEVGDILGLSTILFLQLGADQVAAEILVHVRGEMSDAVADGMAMPLALVLAAAHKWVELAALIGAAPTTDAADAALSVAVMARAQMDEAAAQLFIVVARDAAEEFASERHGDAAARWLMLATFIAVEHERWADVDEMLARVTEVTRRHADDPHLYELAGKARWNLGDHAGALENYQRAWKLGWRSEQAVAALGEALMVNGHYRKAFRHLDAAYPALMTRWALLMLVSLDAVIDLTDVEKQHRNMFVPDETWVEDVEDPDELMRLLRDRDALNASLLNKYAEATETISLGITVWTAIVTELPLFWSKAVLLAGVSEVDEPILEAIVEAAALTQPDVIETLRDLQEQLEAPLPDEFLDRAAAYADGAMEYEGPASIPFNPMGLLSGF